MLDIKNTRPILVVPAMPYEKGIRLMLPSEQIDIDSTMSDIVWKIIGLSNGLNNIEKIIKESGLDEEFVSKIIDDLITLKAMYDSSELHLHFHEISQSPDTYFKVLSHDDILLYTSSPRKAVKNGDEIQFEKENKSPLSKLIFNRRSCRSFSNEKLSKDIIGNICYHGYSLTKHTVPSGGALYPLKIYVLVEREQENLTTGYYEYDSERDVLICFNTQVDIEQLKYCFNDETMPFGSSVQIVIAADLKRQSYKYSNRGYRLTLIEAGHVAQNISLYCIENGLESCELGGVLDTPLIEELGISGNEISPLITIAVGKAAKEERFDYIDFKNKIENTFVGTDKPVKMYDGYFLGKGSSFFGAYSIYGENNAGYAGATASSAPHAILKAIIEGYERHQSGNPQIDYYGCAECLDDEWLNPKLIRPLTKEQAKSDNLVEFSESLPIDWTKGKYINSGKMVLVPSELIYYGNNIENKICLSDSSGVAAYTEYNNAIMLATLELVERDALMRNWYERKSPPRFSEEILDIHVKKRIQYWEEHGRQVHVLDMMSSYATTIQVVITGSDYPCFVSGASATINDTKSAILKALREAEFSLYLALKNPQTKKMKPQDVYTPNDHGLLYASPEYIENIKWLWESVQILGSFPTQKYSYDDLLNQLNPIVIDMSDENAYIKVVRVLSEKCLPISFGYGMDYFTHPIVVKNLDVNLESRKLPHYFS